MSEVLNKKALSENIAEEFDFTKKVGTEIVNYVLETFTEVLAKGGTVELSGFGKFEVRHRPERPGINPATKERIVIKASNSPAFKAAKGLKDAVNQ
ncbi:MAG: HU family DNA-binding protein [Erysipelothrix sp.]|nr:HU family DNA-binding protein [Erysipelothrix sp.]